MQAHLAIVEPLRLRAVHRWLTRNGAFLVCSRQWEPGRKGVAQRRRMTGGPDDLLRLLRTPTLFRGRSLNEAQLLEQYPELLAVAPGDLLIVPHLPHRDAFSLHVVGPDGLVQGSSATTALPVGIAVVESFGLDCRICHTDERAAALCDALPRPTGPLTSSRQLTCAARALLSTLRAGSAVQEPHGTV